MKKISMNSPGFKGQALFKLAAALCFLIIMNPGSLSGQTNQWEPKHQNGEVEAFAQIDKCNQEQDASIFVKFVNNSTASDYEVSYVLTVADDPTFPPVNGTITIAGGSSSSGDCETPFFTGLRLPCGPEVTNVSQLSVSFTLTQK